MKRKVCKECNHVFMAEKDWEKMCIVCWKESKEMDLLNGDRQVRLLQKELAEVEAQQSRVDEYNKRLDVIKQSLTLDTQIRDRMKDLLLLCHPDKHQNSNRSEEITRWLLELRKKPHVH